MSKKWIYLFEEVEEAEKYVDGKWDKVRALLGGKGANLAEMTRVGIPVPPGFTVTTEACNAYADAGEQFPEGMWEQELEALKAVEKAMGKKFGDPENPLLMSCRSGAKFSMPGMMDTVLNIGLNDVSVEGLAKLTEDARFAYDSYRRLVQMFGSVVMNVEDDLFEHVLTDAREKAGVKTDSELNAEQWKVVTAEFKKIIKKETGTDFPQEPIEQIKLATEAVFKSWNGKRAIDYRNAAGIAHDLGTGVNIMTMVFGNMGNNSGTGVAFTRDPATGENILYGDYLINAQGEDVVAGVRNTEAIADMKKDLPEAFKHFVDICDKLENHYKEIQDVEFTVEDGKLWMLQTRDGKRTAKAAVKIAVDMVNENLIDKKQAVLRVAPEQVNTLLHPQFDPKAKKVAAKEGKLLAKAVNASPGAAGGVVAFDADLAETWGKEEGKNVIMVRPFTRPDDVHGMLAAQGILTSEGGATSHAAVVARQFGVPCIVGASDVKIDLNKRQFEAHGVVVKEGDYISIDGTTGEAFVGEIDMIRPEFEEQTDLITLLEWADEFRRLEVWANADNPQDAQRSRDFGAQGIGLCRTEHMFFEERLPIMQRMILAIGEEDRSKALDELLPFQRSDFEGLFKAMDGLPVIIRLVDPPLHEFLEGLYEELKQKENLTEEEQQTVRTIESMHESNPMMGLRGIRLGVMRPGIVKMQVRAIFEAACNMAKAGIDVKPEVMIPLVGHVNELNIIQPQLEEVAKAVMAEKGINVEYLFGTMIEIPRAALTADEIAKVAQFFSFGTNDLSQLTYGYSRDDAEATFLLAYVDKKILPTNPFQTIDRDGVGALMKMSVEKGRSINPDISLGICGEHGGDPNSIEFCHLIGLNYVSCSPFRVPVARLAAAHAALNN
ncbi:MAG: pyruvate, phosphate dikinase [Anaerolineaceae bacterium 4572_78]|nr:MAG: pyruvate, phosphate dikinase [Anaerolineaceae bacterium 4572_78]